MADAILCARPQLEAFGEGPLYVTQAHDVVEQRLHAEMLGARGAGSRCRADRRRAGQGVLPRRLPDAAGRPRHVDSREAGRRQRAQRPRQPGGARPRLLAGAAADAGLRIGARRRRRLRARAEQPDGDQRLPRPRLRRPLAGPQVSLARARRRWTCCSTCWTLRHRVARRGLRAARGRRLHRRQTCASSRARTSWRRR